ncbi:MAG: hypothetical protein VKJ66_05360 [Synechococcus sp.]|nr:hypothetical protein [Synechococcus sp.]
MSEPAAAEPFPQAFTLAPLQLQLRRQPGPLLPQIHRALTAHGRPLRWAITAVDPASQTLTLEAVVIGPPDPP